MTSPALASPTKLVSAGFDEARALDAIAEASVRVHFETGSIWVDTSTGALVDNVPDIVGVICLRAARRSLENPEQLVAHTESLGEHSETKQYQSRSAGDVFLTNQEKADLRKAAGLVTGLSTISTTRGDIETAHIADRADDLGGPWER